MGLVYSENEGRKPGGMLNVHAMNPHKPYATHLNGWYYLKFILQSSTDFTEKRQAQRELVICERKLAFWYRHPMFDIAQGAQLTQAAKTAWKSTFEPAPHKVRKQT